MTPTPEQLVRDDFDWLRKRCSAEARRLTPGHGGRDDVANEILQGAVVEFLERAAEWFSQPTRSSLKAQARTLLSSAILHERTKYIAGQQRMKLHDVTCDSDDPHDTQDAVDRVESETAYTEDDIATLLSRGAETQRLWAAVATLNVVRRLYLLAVYHPARVEAVLCHDAAREKRGGGTPVVREPQQAYDLLDDKRQDDVLLADASEWRKTVAEILRSNRPLGAMSAAELALALNALDQYVSRARRDLRKALPGESE